MTSEVQRELEELSINHPPETAELINVIVRSLERELPGLVFASKEDDILTKARHALVDGAIAVMLDSGVNVDEAAAILEQKRLALLRSDAGGWTEELNSRRIALIDTSLQRPLTQDESTELHRLTERMRATSDAEETLSISAAEKRLAKLRKTP